MMTAAITSAVMALALQAQPPSYYADSRLQSVDYRAEQVVTVEAATGYQVTILLSADERIESIAVGDSGAWQVAANNRGNMVFVKLTQPGLATNMTVVTDVRTYAFDLIPLGTASNAMPYTLSFNYPTDAPDDLGMPQDVVARYRMSGTKSLWPSAISDDGVKTYIEWPRNVDLPAIYALDQAGREVLVNGMVRGDNYVMDQVAARLVFRIDKRVARARRRPIEEADQ